MNYDINLAIDKMAELKIINSPDYWKEHYKDTKYVDQLFIKAANKITSYNSRAKDVKTAVENLVNANIINSPNYWLNKTGNVAELLKALGGAVAPTLKYSDDNPPMVCMMTNSTCYKGTSKMTIKGILWHSTGANNPTLRRYVQPSNNDPNYKRLMEVIGKNNEGSDWNHMTVKAGLNAWIGKLKDGEVTTIQAMPWNYKPWGCGSGSMGSCNNGWIQFEICEDSLNDQDYFEKTYEEACQLTAYLCKKYNIDPNGYVTFNGLKVPTILCHAESHKLQLGSNHADVLHWFPKYGKNMATVREDVTHLINLGITPSAPVQPIEKQEQIVAPVVVEPAPPTVENKGKVTASALNVRSGPGTNYSILRTVRKNTVLTFEKEQQGWGKLKDQKGWVSLTYIKKI